MLHRCIEDTILYSSPMLQLRERKQKGFHQICLIEFIKQWGEWYRLNIIYVMYTYEKVTYTKSERCKVGGSLANGKLRLTKREP